jgi:hypothetical protein
MAVQHRYFKHCWQHRHVHSYGSRKFWYVNLFRFLSLVCEKATEKIGYKYFWTFFSYFGRMHQRFFIITETKDCLFYKRNKSVFSTVQFTVPVFSVSSFRGTFEASKTKYGGVAIDGPPQGSVNGPVVLSWSRAFCYKLPVMYKVFHPLFYVSQPAFRSSSIIMCNWHGVSSEKTCHETH